jgi:hypothetical protein
VQDSSTYPFLTSKASNLSKMYYTADGSTDLYTNDLAILTVCLIVLILKYVYKSEHVGFLSLLNCAISLPWRILCETVKDFVAKVEKAYDKSLENAVVAEAVASKVREHWGMTAVHSLCFVLLCLQYWGLNSGPGAC